MMNKRLLLSLSMCGILSTGLNLHAQNINSPDQKLVPASMTGKNFRQLFTPNLFNGTMQVSVPIYSYSHGGNDYGISLSYDTKGIPVDAISSPEGLNWSLVASPSIVRVIKDIPDDINESANAMIADNMPNKEQDVLGKLATYMETAQQKTRTNVYRDGEADEFIVSLGGSSFKFYIGPDDKFYTIPHRNVKIELIANQYYPVHRTSGEQIHWGRATDNLEFRITDEQGNKFYFTNCERQSYELDKFADWQQVEYSAHWAPPISWRPERIVLADGKEIHYSYSSSNFGIQYGFSFNAYKNTFIKEKRNGSTYSVEDAIEVNISDDHMPVTHFVKKIAYPNGVTANLEYATDSSRSSINGTPLLDRINLSSGDNSISYQFFQSKVNGRWFLDSIKMISGDGSYQEPYYSFEYNQVTLPSRLNMERDFYGYFNGNASCTPPNGYSNLNKITVPKHPGINYGNNRSYDASFAQAGLLTKVKNAFGAEDNYYYGANVCSNVFGNIIPPGEDELLGRNAVDGVRIDSVVHKDKYHPGSSTTMKFSYSNGQLFIPGGKFYYPYHIDSLSNAWDIVMYQSKFITAHQLVQGSNHGYSNVSVKTYGLNGKLLSRKDITFTNMKDATSNNQPRYYKVPGSKDYFEYPFSDKQYIKDWEIGLPLTITDYDQNNRMVSKMINQYEFSSIDHSAENYLQNTKTAEVNSGHQQLFPGKQTFTEWYPYKKSITDTYYPYTGKANLVRRITKGFVSDQLAITDTILYYYDTHNNLVSVVQRNSNGEKIARNLIYNYNVDGPEINDNNPGTTLYKMTEAGLEKVVATETWKLDPNNLLPFGENNQLLAAHITLYEYQDGKLWEKGKLKTNIGNPMSYEQYTGLSMGGTYQNRYGKILDAYNTTGLDTGFLRLNEVTLFDSIGNPLEIKYLNQNNYSASIWDPQSGNLLASASNCRFKDLGYVAFESDYSSTDTDPYGYEGNFTFAKGNVVSLPYLSVNGVPNKCYQLKPNGGSSPNDFRIVGNQILTAGKEYLLSFWYSGQKPAIKVGAQSIPFPNDGLITTVGNWKNYVLHFTPTASGVLKFVHAGSGATYLDDIRLCPSDALMQSKTYAPLFGTSSETDAGGHIIRYGFDQLGRRTVMRDREFRILSAKQYHIGK